MNLPPAPTVKLQKPKKPREREFVDTVCRDLELKGVSYQREVKTPVGYIDILTDDCLYEAKHWADIKHAVGQILFYGFYHPRPRYVLLVFAKTDKGDVIDMQYIGQCMAVLDGLGLAIHIDMI